MQPLCGIANFEIANLNEMKALHHDINRFNIEKQFLWLITVLLLVAGLPLLKNIIVFILVKLYELFIQQTIGK